MQFRGLWLLKLPWCFSLGAQDRNLKRTEYDFEESASHLRDIFARIKWIYSLISFPMLDFNYQ